MGRDLETVPLGHELSPAFQHALQTDRDRSGQAGKGLSIYIHAFIADEKERKQNEEDNMYFHYCNTSIACMYS